MNEPKLAIVHERFTEIAGSEHVVEQLSLTWPHAAVHVPLARPAGIPAGLSSPPVTTWADGAYRTLRRSSYAPLMPLLPSAFRGMKLGEVDAVVVSPPRIRYTSGLRHRRPRDRIRAQPGAVGVGSRLSRARVGRRSWRSRARSTGTSSASGRVESCESPRPGSRKLNRGCRQDSTLVGSRSRGGASTRGHPRIHP